MDKRRKPKPANAAGAGSAAASGETKTRLRLLKCLNGADTRLRRRDGATVIVTAGGKDHRFPAALFDRLLAERLVGRAGKSLRLTDSGSALLKRLLHPNEPFLAQHADRAAVSITQAGTTQKAVVNTGESPLARLYTRKTAKGGPWLSDEEFAAGERLRADFEKSRLGPKISANWNVEIATGRRGGEAAEISDFALDARRRLDKAIAMLGPELADLALDVCCFLKGLEQVERERRWPPRSAKLMLRAALRLLVSHYGLNTGNGRRRIGRWGSADYRPRLS